MDKHDERLLWLGDAHIDEATLNKIFGRVLAKLRGTDDFNPTRTAQHSGLDRAFLYAVERGEKGISLFTLFRIASASKLSASDIVRRLEQELSSETKDAS
jgi:hypothetical protein